MEIASGPAQSYDEMGMTVQSITSALASYTSHDHFCGFLAAYFVPIASLLKRLQS